MSYFEFIDPFMEHVSRGVGAWVQWLAVLCACQAAAAQRGCPSVCACASEREAQCRGASGDLRLLAEALDARTEDLEAVEGSARTLRAASWRALPRARRLVLERNGVAAVEDGAFAGLLALRELSLAHNLLRRLPPRLLERTAALDRLFLSGNPLTLPEDEPFLWSPSLRWLQLDGCGLLRLPGRTFQGLPNLRVLQLRENGLEILGRAVLPLSRLNVLALQGNRLVRQSFLLPPNLALLNLNDNDFSALEEGAFDETANLEYLMLENNYVTSINSGSLLPLQKLKFLELGGNKLNDSFAVLTSPAAIELANLRNLSSLKLQDNDMEILNLEVFVKMKSLKELSLSRNKIKTVANGLWDGLEKSDTDEIPKLEILSLSENKIDFLGTSLRLYMNSLLSLNLSSNRLVSFSSSRLTLEARSSIKILDLSHNRINPSYAKTLDLDYLPDLEYLSLCQNNMESMNENTFRRLKRLKHLDLSVNKFKMLPANIFRNLKELRFLYLKFLNMNDGVEQWPANVLDPLVNLEVLSLEGNNIRNTSPLSFRQLKHLRELDLSYNNLEFLSLDSLANNVNLQYLNLKYNRIEYFRCGTLCSFTSMTKLDMEGNSLRTLPKNLSYTFPSLEQIDVSKNLLKTLDFEALEDLENLSSVRASYNPVTCDCSVRAFWEVYGGAGNQTVDATCQEPGGGATQPWSAVAALRCGGPAGAALAAGVGALLLLVAANALLGAALLCGWGRRGACASTDALLPCADGRRGAPSDDHEDDGDNERNRRVERWRGKALYYGTDSEDEETDPARAGLAYGYDALRWAAARRAQSRSSVCVHSAAAY